MIEFDAGEVFHDDATKGGGGGGRRRRHMFICRTLFGCAMLTRKAWRDVKGSGMQIQSVRGKSKGSGENCHHVAWPHMRFADA